jgi:excisionase family DNA binding protein
VEDLEGRGDRLLTVVEVAEYFRVEPESVRRWLREGKLLGINLGRGPGWRIRVGDIEDFITERHTRAGEQSPDNGEDVDAAEGLP